MCSHLAGFLCANPVGCFRLHRGALAVPELRRRLANCEGFLAGRPWFSRPLMNPTAILDPIHTRQSVSAHLKSGIWTQNIVSAVSSSRSKIVSCPYRYHASVDGLPFPVRSPSPVSGGARGRRGSRSNGFETATGLWRPEGRAQATERDPGGRNVFTGEVCKSLQHGLA